MAGVDTLDVLVRVHDGARVIKQYTTGVGSTGLFDGATSTGRFRPMSDVVAQRVAERLGRATAGAS
jgi:hypothetical protein